MDLKSRKRLSLLILLLGLPGYIVIAWMLMAWIDDTGAACRSGASC